MQLQQLIYFVTVAELTNNIIITINFIFIRINNLC